MDISLWNVTFFVRRTKIKKLRCVRQPIPNDKDYIKIGIFCANLCARSSCCAPDTSGARPLLSIWADSLDWKISINDNKLFFPQK